MLALDFETYYDDKLNVKILGPKRYIHDLLRLNHPPYLISLCNSEGDSYAGPLSEVDWNRFSVSKGIVAHNASFDKAVYEGCVKADLVPVAGLGVPWRCTADMAAFLHSPRSLKGAAKSLLGIDLKKDIRDNMKGKRFEDLTPEERREVTEYALKDAEVCLALWAKYSNQWPDVEQQISELNREIGLYGVALDFQLVSKYKDALHLILFEAEKQLPWRNKDDGSEAKAVLSPTALAVTCREHDIPCPSTVQENSPECEMWEEEYGDKFPWVDAMRRYRKANGLLKKLITMEQQSIDNILPFNLLYFGAHTGRFSGSNRMNLQNLPNRKASDTPLRRVIIPRPKHQLCVIDWAQIEPRVEYWMVKDRESLDALRDGAQIYELYARRHMGYTDPEPLKKKNPKLYGAAKASVLGLGYGCGANKFVIVAKALADLDLTLEEAQQQVNQYRSSNPRIVTMWNQLIFRARMHASRGEDYMLSLPSGRTLHYYNLKYSKTGKGSGLRADVCMDGSRVAFLHGGKITENWVQATARDVFALGLLRLRDNGFQNLFHVHDEYVLEIPTSCDRKETEKKIRRILLAPIPWLEGCPLDVTIDWRECYG